MLSPEAKAKQKEAKRLWYENNKDTYKNPNPAKVAETARKAALKYYHKNKSKINSKNQKIYTRKAKAKVAERIAKTLEVREAPLDIDYSFLPKRYNLPFKTVWSPPIKSEGGFFPLS